MNNNKPSYGVIVGRFHAWPNDELITVFKNGEVLVKHTFDQIRERAK